VIGTQLSAVARVLHSAAALQQAHVAPADSVVVQSPLPGGIAQVVRFLLNTVPPWVQAGGVVVAVVVAAFVLRVLFRHRSAIRGWLASRGGGVKLALAAAAVVLIAGTAGIGAATWNYTQHSNDFCVGCHVMNPAFQKFGDVENKHGKLSCHECHQQSLLASGRQLYLWVAERPEKIGKHAKVANKVCESCHVTADTATWQRIASTAGHRVHLESDSSALKNLQCVTCHGVELHRFKPVTETCGQSNCHKASETGIVLGRMGAQTVLHCTSCHAFTADVPALATRDSARGTLVPGKPECLGCHEMQKVLADFDEAKDPHGGKCGTCHHPHVQKTPAAAVTSCATAGCHANWRDEPFHVGANHKKVGAQCLTCHMPHRATADASACEGCHLSVRARGKLRPPLPFDTTRALRRVGTPTAPQPPEATYPESRHSVMTGSVSGGGPGPESSDDAMVFERDEATPEPDSAGVRLSRPPPAKADSFPHARHVKFACLECHETGTGHGRLTFEAPRGCAICHHQAPTAARCASCHRPEKYAAAKHATVTVTVPGHQPNPRPVDFLHSLHATRTCVECHTTPVTLAPSPTKAQCKDCHSEHHALGGNCSACHTIAEPKAEHRTLEAAHQRCDACHTATTIAELTPTRNFCSACHAAKAKGHYDQKECSVCHFLAEPRVYRSRLLTSRPG
jgi:nitrate/TMAO reductase-like tetraheme cytochrome c subunit